MNARAPLRISSSDDCWEHVHPDVVYLPEEFAGYRYWMVFTPYPKMNDRLENPTLRASLDGLVWVKPSDVPEPIVQAPADPETHHADPDMIFRDGLLYVIYVTTHRKVRKSKFSVVSSCDGVHWSDPRTIYEGFAVSPACIVDDNGHWHVWFIMDKTWLGSTELLHRHGHDLANLGDERPCQLDIPGYVPWHIDVQRVESGYEAFIAAFPKGTDNSRTRLFHAVSRDGLSFVLSRFRPILKPSTFGWDNKSIYRCSFLKESNGSYRIWYSALSWGGHPGIGHVQGPLDALRENPSAPVAPLPAPYVRLWGDIWGLVTYEAFRHLPYQGRIEQEKGRKWVKEDKRVDSVSPS